MPREILSTNAPLSAAGSAAQQALFDKDHPAVFIRAMETYHVTPKFSPKLRLVAGGAPVIAPVAEGPDQLIAASANYLDDDNWSESYSDSLEAKTDARLDDRGSRAPFLTAAEKDGGESKARSASLKSGRKQTSGNSASTHGKPRRSGLKKLNKKQITLDWPPAPRGCEWRRSADGLNLWRCWTDWDDDKTRRIKKSRYAGHLSDDAWRIMKEYDHEAFISIVGEQLRRHSGR
jgi:hypothetical protein